MMKSKPYPKYKSSGVEWLGEVPEHWLIERLRRISKRLTDGSHISPDLSSSEYPFVSTVDIKEGKINFEDCIKTSSECYEYLVQNGCMPFEHDVLFSKDGTVGRTAVINFTMDFVVASSLVIISPKKNTIFSNYLDYWLNNSLLQQEVMLQVSGAAIRRISVEKIGRLPVAFPPLPEQQTIAAFLDRETTRIDSLTDKKKKLVELLAEQRTALISRAVTKGLDAGVKLKPSGVEWLGEVPEHWGVKKGKYLGILQSTPNVSEEEQTEDGGSINYVKVEDLNTPENVPYFVKSKLDCLINKKPYVENALIFPKRGAAIFTNKVSILRGKALLDPNMMGWEIYRKYDLNYFYFTLRLRTLDDLADTSTVPQINNKHIYPEIFPLPPLPEQQAIAAFLDRETARIDALMSKVESAIDKLKEYRTALISAVVTGKIDVREAV